ncbi:hypothetical protein B9Q01_03650 [Candidatus Marsarchaeota G1 archaeon OSP_D]|uniref:Uncharacterized protein n=3 Tax=Candidatus Marsarchaeota group 1 TaxID=2203770 RepID=A0A2R6AJ23_9ARCH|nr:MAG: hypothetical protein B9Q01_03650 [Candidatus Marsarchaeota G1 archaeon OSP_D]PSN86375.1 MAG: hypothetical protein B9Q02_02475 [Candidatus Marsarchaeota G1 archaeon BE_D]PSN88522.1 MAG: hypothetical protein B9Q00_05100 [Candidatus Marsarchaeota G1 archaeon OSP_C]
MNKNELRQLVLDLRTLSFKRYTPKLPGKSQRGFTKLVKGSLKANKIKKNKFLCLVYPLVGSFATRSRFGKNTKHGFF